MRMSKIMESTGANSFSISDVRMTYAFGTSGPEIEIRNGEIYCCGPVTVTRDSLKEVDGKRIMKYPFHTIKEDSFTIWANIDTLVGCPKIINGDFFIEGADISNLEGFPEKVTGYIRIEGNVPNLNSLTGISKYLKECHRFIEIPRHIESAILGILLVKGLNKNHAGKRVDLTYSRNRNEKLMQAVEILNSHLDQGGDLIDCKRELISAGLKEYARL